MSKKVSAFAVVVLFAFGVCQPGGAQAQPQASKPSEGVSAKKFSFDNDRVLTNWTTTGDVTVDPTKGHKGTSGSLRIGPGSRAMLRLREKDESGQVADADKCRDAAMAPSLSGLAIA